MENKSLKKGLDNLPFPQYYNSDISDYETVQGKNGASFVEVKNSTPILFRLEETGIVLPVDIKGVEKVPLYMYESTNELADTVVQSTAFDFANKKVFSGIVSSSANITMYIQESANQVQWFTTSKVNIVATTSESVGLSSYDNVTSFNVEPSLRYVRILLLIGSTALTKLVVQSFGSNL